MIETGDISILVSLNGGSEAVADKVQPVAERVVISMRVLVEHFQRIWVGSQV